jgi:nucleoside-diphosphate-sugar epimerase
MKSEKIVVCGGGGFIGGHLVADLVRQGHQDVRSIDIKPLDEWYQRTPGVENLQLDLSLLDAADKALKGAHTVYNLAADMGGMGFIENNKALCMLTVLINTETFRHTCGREIIVAQGFERAASVLRNSVKTLQEHYATLRTSDVSTER